MTPTSSRSRSSSTEDSILLDDPPAAWFNDPGLEEPTPITVTAGGRVYGHAALWGTCHVGIQGQCVQPPRAGDGYSNFMLGGRRAADGHEYAVGQITMGTTHADLNLSASATQRHYEHTGWAIADVAVGEDKWGPWFAGAVRRGTSERDAEELRGAKISGDWRTRGGRLSLVGLLAVNIPGFPVPRPRARLAASAAGVMTVTADGRLRGDVDLDAREALVAMPVPRRADVRAAIVAGMGAFESSLAASAQIDALAARMRQPDAIADLLARARG